MRIRKTRQKQLIEEEMSKLSTFFDADELHSKLSGRDKGIGAATVYRFLKEMVTEGKVHSYICNRRMIYSLNEKSHCHFICEKCGNVIHFDIKKLDFLQEEIKSPICHFQIDVTGICEKCQK